MSSGGLVSTLSGTKKSMSSTWIGSTGLYIPPKDRHIVDKRLMEEYSCQAVYLDDDVTDRHYDEFSNSTLWLLFHCHPDEMNFDEEKWLAYRIVNMHLAEVVRQQVRENSMVWVQDHHLMLLPMLLRGLVTGPELTSQFTADELANITNGTGVESEEYPMGGRETVRGVKIGFFLHTPFPSNDIYGCVVFVCLCLTIIGARGAPLHPNAPF
jgi:trehalose 6-phosphate synthase